jgi:predicted alpha/beta superfamily hydrolase
VTRNIPLALLFTCVAPVVGTAAELRHETLRIESPRLGETRRINVYLPPDYDRCTAERYDVLYMPDGGTAEDFPHVASAVDDLVRSSRMRPLIVVGLENTNRRRDMTGPTDDPEDLKSTKEPGGSGKLRDFFRYELQPIIDARYRTNDTRAIIGESFAGLFIVESMLRAPDLFDTYVALDPSLWWNKARLTQEAAPLIAAWPAGTQVRLQFASAGDGNIEEVEQFATMLRDTPTPALQWKYEPRPDLKHGNIYLGMERPVLQALFPLIRRTTCPTSS